LIRELALVCEDTSIVSILNRLGYRTGNGNTWTEKRVQHVRHTNGFPACPPPDQRLWITMQQAAATLRVSEMVVRRLIAQKSLPASFPRCEKRFVEFTWAGALEGRLTKTKLGYSRTRMKLSLEALRTRQSSRFDPRCQGSPYWITEALPSLGHNQCRVAS
jgi:excisionase family DNA binding protein